MASIELDRVRKVYEGGVVALEGMSLDIADGEFVVFVGPSGCGKSTALKLIAGLEEVTSGHVLIGGRDVTDAAPKDRDIAMVFQNYALYPHLSVRRNLGFALRMRRIPAEEINRRVDSAARILGIHPLLDRRPRQLSGGQRQRVALGRAIVREPRAFLMDEPLSNLDARLRVLMRAEIGALHNRLKVTTIFVTHDQTEAMTMADRIVIMREGVIQQVGDPDEVYARPRNVFVAGFIGSPAMNFFRSTLKRDGGSWCVTLGDLALPVRVDGGAAVPRADGPVIVGLRPEAMGDAARGTVELDAVASLVESLGGERHVYFPVPEENVVSLASAREGEEGSSGLMVARLMGIGRIREGERISLPLDTQRLHLFDADSEEALN